MNTKLTPRLINDTADVVSRLMRFEQPADAVLSGYFRDNRELGPRERAFVAETAYAVLRHRRLLERACGGAPTPRHLVLTALTKVFGESQRQLGECISAADMKWLTEMKSIPEPVLSLAERADFPDWLVDRLQHPPVGAGLDDEALLVLARGLNQPASLDLRVNAMKANREEVLDHFRRHGTDAQPCRYAPFGIRLATKPSLARHALFLKGCFEVQDEGSQLLGHLLAPKRGDMVVDFCAGAGGKTLLLGALMRSTGRLYAFDVSEKRLARLKPRVARSGLSNVHPAAIASERDPRVKRLAGKIDRVLVDAPCSGLGTLRRNPDLKWRQTPESIAELTRKQADILASASRLVKKGGRLVYATCSLLAEENEVIVDGFLAAHPEFHRVSCAEILARQAIALDTGEDLRLLPHRHGTDGFYAAVLERQA